VVLIAIQASTEQQWLNFDPGVRRH
jgi:hypothetical protein